MFWFRLLSFPRVQQCRRTTSSTLRQTHDERTTGGREEGGGGASVAPPLPDHHDDAKTENKGIRLEESSGSGLQRFDAEVTLLREKKRTT